MLDVDLKKLAELNPPPAREEVRASALEAALEVFDDQIEDTTPENLGTTQETASSHRPTSTINQLWSHVMNSISKPTWNLKPIALATASGVVVLPVASLIAWNLMEDPIQTSVSPAPAGDYRIRQMQPEPAKPEETVSIVVRPDGEIASAPVRSMQKSLDRVQPQALYSSSQPLAETLSAAQPVLSPTVRQSTTPDQSERYERFEDNGVTSTRSNPVSTFSIDVDTASYARVRSAINAGDLPFKDMVRVEEMINYFDYAYPTPEAAGQPFKPTITLTQTPWNAHTQLLQIGIKGYDPSVGSAASETPDTNLVLLLDVSGSMSDRNKLPLLIKSFKLLLRKLKPTDTVSIVTYAGRSATVLDSVKAADRATILQALEGLQAGGSTAGAGGIEQAYRLAEKNFVAGGVNRVMLATDGDFNVGISEPHQLKDLIAKKRKSGVFLSVFGFGQVNYNDALMQSLAQNGNGQAAYIDSLAEAHKVMVEEAGGTMFTIASDVKIQMEFNPAKIAEYRLIGYETRALKREDFNNDKVDAGEIGAGHTVTALYELTPVGSPATLTEPLRYGDENEVATDGTSHEIGYLKLRYKLPGDSKSTLMERAIVTADWPESGSELDRDSRFAAAVAAFGQKLRGNSALDEFSYQQIADLAASNRG
ncbi:MAG: VWA domain-containing protein, partial [Pseudomonadota bacterium]